MTSFNNVNAVNKLVQSFWEPMMMKELRENTFWANLIKSNFGTYMRNGNEVPIKGGDTVYISQINKPTSTVKTIGTDADSFSTNTLSSKQVTFEVNKRAVSAYEFEDLGILMSQLENEDSEIRASLMADCKEQINDYIKSLISPSSSAPDHTLTSVTDYNLAQVSAVRTLAAAAKWGSANEPWFKVLAPSFYSDVLDDTTMADVRYGASDAPVIAGKTVLPRLNFNILEDNSLSNDTGFAFLPSFMFGAFGTPQFKVSDLHAQGKFGFNISCNVVFGAKQWDDERVISIA